MKTKTNLDLTGSSIKKHHNKKNLTHQTLEPKKKSHTPEPGTKKTIILLPKIFHKSRTSPPHCSQSPWIYNNWPKWACAWLVSGLHLLGLCTHRGFSGMTAHHIQQAATVHWLFIYVTSLCRLSSWGSASWRRWRRADSVANVSNQDLCLSRGKTLEGQRNKQLHTSGHILPHTDL